MGVYDYTALLQPRWLLYALWEWMNDAHLVWSRAKCQSTGFDPTDELRDDGRSRSALPLLSARSLSLPLFPLLPVLAELRGGLAAEVGGSGRLEEAEAAATAAAMAAALAPPIAAADMLDTWDNEALSPRSDEFIRWDCPPGPILPPIICPPDIVVPLFPAKVIADYTDIFHIIHGSISRRSCFSKSNLLM